MRSPYYVGLVAHYPTRPLDMEDDPENPKQKTVQPLRNKRQPQVLQKGLHEPIYSQELWESNMQLRASKGNTPTKLVRPRREYLLTGIGRCWVCLEHNGEQVGFRGSTGDNQLQYYRCATVQEKAKGKGKVEPIDLAAITGVSPQNKIDWAQLIAIANHKPTMRADLMEGEIEKLITQLVIPEDWYELILSYYVSEHGMADFERESYNLRQELNRAKELYINGFINLAQFQEKALRISKNLEAKKPAAQPEVHVLLPSLKDFKGIWANCTAAERRKLLKVMLLAVYYDSSSSIQMVLAHNPFDQLLPIKTTNRQSS